MAGENINRRLNIYINDREVTNSMRGVTAEMTKVRNSIKSLNRGAADYDQKLKELTDTYAKLQKEQARFRDDLNKTPGILNKIKTALGPVATGMLSAFSITALVSGFTNKVREAARIVVDFDQKQADLAAIMQKSRVQIAGLTLDAIKYGASTSYSAAEVSILQTELARLGKTAPEIKAMTQDVLNAATALETDLGSAATLIGGQLNSYGESADKAGKYSDIMANSVNVSATSFESLNTALPKVSKVAALNNVTFEKLNATLGVLADENVAAETAGTGFRNILLESAKAGKPYQEMLDEIKKSANQSKKAVELFGKENATVAVIMANSSAKINDQTKALENSAGSAEKLAKEKMNSILGSTKNFSSAWEGFILNIEKGDGAIGKGIKSIIDLGTSFLSLITPMKQVSDQLKEEQFEMNMLVYKINSSNTSNEERKRLIIQLKQEYPAFNKYLKDENATTDEVWKALRKVNEEYVKRITLQKQVEIVEKASAKVADKVMKQQEEIYRIYQNLNRVNLKYKLGVEIDEGDLEKSAREMKAVMDKRFGRGSGSLVGQAESGVISDALEKIRLINIDIKERQAILDEELKKQDFLQKTLNIQTETENEKLQLQKEGMLVREQLIKQATELGMIDAKFNTTAEIKRWIDLEKEKALYTGEMSDEEKKKMDEEQKKREKAISDAKKHSEDLQKELENSEKALLETKRAFQDIDSDLLKDGFEKERVLINREYDRKIEDLKNNIAKEQKEIDALNQQLKDPKNSKGDVELLRKQIQNKIALQKVFNNTMVSLDQTRDLKLAALQEKYIQKSLKKQEDDNDKALDQLQTRHNNELQAISSLEDAKKVLSAYLTEAELLKVKTLEAAKKKIKEQQQKEEFEMQEQHLIDLMAMVQSIFAQEQLEGFSLISPEEREALLKFLDDAALKLSKLGVKKSEKDTDTTAEGIKSLSGVDILGFSPEDWQSAFDSLDTFAEKIGAIEIITGAMRSAFGSFFDFLDAKDQHSLNKYRSNVDKKKKALQDQLDKGYITQDQYNSRIANLEAELEKKQAELEYKKAKRQKIQSALEITVNTGIGIMKAVAASPLTGGMPWAAIIAGLGAVQLASVLASPLPPKAGYKKGGFTGSGNSNDEAGVVHKREYVVPENVLFSRDPVVPNVVDYLERKRQGENPVFNPGQTPETAGESISPILQYENAMLTGLVERAVLVLEKLEADGLETYLVNDLKTARKMKQKIKELSDHESNAKL